VSGRLESELTGMLITEWSFGTWRASSLRCLPTGRGRTGDRRRKPARRRIS